MREILFRGKTILGEWVYGDLEHNGKNTPKWVDGKEIIPETIGQFTGLTDKNGKKIFEGDILKGSKVRDMMIVVFSQSGCFIVVSCGGWWDFIDNIGEIEVIGNIIDNKELLDIGEKV